MSEHYTLDDAMQEVLDFLATTVHEVGCEWFKRFEESKMYSRVEFSRRGSSTRYGDLSEVGQASIRGLTATFVEKLLTFVHRQPDEKVSLVRLALIHTLVDPSITGVDSVTIKHPWGDTAAGEAYTRVMEGLWGRQVDAITQDQLSHSYRQLSDVILSDTGVMSTEQQAHQYRRIRLALSCIKEGLYTSTPARSRMSQFIPPLEDMIVNTPADQSWREHPTVDEAKDKPAERVCQCCNIYRPGSVHESPYHETSLAYYSECTSKGWVVMVKNKQRNEQIELKTIHYCPGCGGKMPEVPNPDDVPISEQSPASEVE